MKNKRVISRESLPSRSPLVPLAVMWLLMDRFRAPEWALGAFALLALLVVAGWLVAAWKEEPENVPPFGPSGDE